MKQIKIYFGKQQTSVLGNYADIIELTVDDKEAERVCELITGETCDWIRVYTSIGVKFINTNRILWFEVNPVLKGDE